MSVGGDIFQLKNDHQTFSGNKLALLALIKPLVETIFISSVFSHLLSILLNLYWKHFSRNWQFKLLKDFEWPQKGILKHFSYIIFDYHVRHNYKRGIQS